MNYIVEIECSSKIQQSKNSVQMLLVQGGKRYRVGVDGASAILTNEKGDTLTPISYTDGGKKRKYIIPKEFFEENEPIWFKILDGYFSFDGMDFYTKGRTVPIGNLYWKM